VNYSRTKRSIFSILLIAVTASIFSNSIFSGLTLLSNSNSNSNPNSYSARLFSQWFPEDNTGIATEVPPGTSIAFAQAQEENSDPPESEDNNENEEESSNEEENDNDNEGSDEDENGDKDQNDEDSGESEGCSSGESYDSSQNKCVSDDTKDEEDSEDTKDEEDNEGEESPEENVKGEETDALSIQLSPEENAGPDDDTQDSVASESSLRPPLFPPASLSEEDDSVATASSILNSLSEEDDSVATASSIL
jgi:hypothetical protein